MTPIEQAREALTEEQIVKLVVDLRCGPSTSTDVGVHLRKYQTLCDRAASALASLSPTTPVDGVGAEPVAVVHRKGNMIGGLLWTNAGNAADLPGGTKLYAAPLASPEAEARLRERVAELEAERHELRMELLACLGQAQDPAEARLAQAEGGPAVTEAVVDRAMAKFWPSDHQRVHFRGALRAALEAALHPQSAAGEEGKP